MWGTAGDGPAWTSSIQHPSCGVALGWHTLVQHPPNESPPRPGSVSILTVLVFNALRAGHDSILSVPPHVFRASKRRRCACADGERIMNSDASNSNASKCRFDVGQPDPSTPNNVFLGSPRKPLSEKKETCSCRGRMAQGWRCANDRLCGWQYRAGVLGTFFTYIEELRPDISTPPSPSVFHERMEAMSSGHWP